MEGMLTAARIPGYSMDVLPSAWTIDEVQGPNVTDKNTVITLATMTSDAYARFHNESRWSDVDGFNRSQPFGWESDGLRGHVFTNEDNSTVVIAIKGTTRGSFYDSGGTSTNDQLNDNLFASCCCAQQGSRWWTAIPGCDCATSTYSCNSTCLVQSMRNESRYYTASRRLYSNVTELYPNSTIWLAGHSLGGMISGLLGLTYGLPTVTFQAVPDALAASRLGLPQPPGSILGKPQTRKLTGIYHVGHTGDPIYMGSCNGPNSLCSVAGFSFESQCHSGQSCIYDVVGDKGWRVSLWYHPISYVIENVLKPYDTVPECLETLECQDCYNWKYYESHQSSTTTTTTTTTTTSTSTSRSTTRTETCKTPGWWGCLDETTTTTTTTSSEMTTTSTSTCKTPGWFGCNDKTTTTTTSELNDASATQRFTETLPVFTTSQPLRVTARPEGRPERA
ncbi:MAG: putative lipase atg15 [Claussenomyces sp. TS43310]|nr:MAG: putative lipase atg15 [Claussenomyces sp. TS43310]